MNPNGRNRRISEDRCQPLVYAGILGRPPSRRSHRARQTLGAYLGCDKLPRTARHHQPTHAAPFRQPRNSVIFAGLSLPTPSWVVTGCPCRGKGGVGDINIRQARAWQSRRSNIYGNMVGGHQLPQRLDGNSFKGEPLHPSLHCIGFRSCFRRVPRLQKPGGNCHKDRGSVAHNQMFLVILLCFIRREDRHASVVQ